MEATHGSKGISHIYGRIQARGFGAAEEQREKRRAVRTGTGDHARDVAEVAGSVPGGSAGGRGGPVGAERSGGRQKRDPTPGTGTEGGRRGARDPKKSGQHFLTERVMKYTFISAHREEF